MAGQPSTAVRGVSVGDVIDGYEIVAPVAQGGMAQVFVARRKRQAGFEKLLAIKVMHPHLRDELAFRHMFMDEARIASRIAHPNVVQVFDVGEHDGMPWLVMELLLGRPAHHIADPPNRRPAAALGTRLAVLAAAAEGLHAAHETRGRDGELLGVVHRDVSPQNVIVGFDGQVKVVDFGIAAARGRLTRTDTGEVKGKWGYISPEQVTGAEGASDRRVDIWSFGVTAWELLAVRRLFGGGDPARSVYRVLNDAIPRLDSVAPDVPEVAVQMVEACLSRDPAGRPATMARVAEALAEAAERCGGHRARDIAEYMERTFGDERRERTAEIEVALRTGVSRIERREGSQSALSPVPSGEPVSSTPIAEAPRGTSAMARGVMIAVIALAAMGAAWAAWSTGGAPDTPVAVGTASALGEPGSDTGSGAGASTGSGATGAGSGSATGSGSASESGSGSATGAGVGSGSGSESGSGSATGAGSGSSGSGSSGSGATDLGAELGAASAAGASDGVTSAVIAPTSETARERRAPRERRRHDDAPREPAQTSAPVTPPPVVTAPPPPPPEPAAQPQEQPRSPLLRSPYGRRSEPRPE